MLRYLPCEINGNIPVFMTIGVFDQHGGNILIERNRKMLIVQDCSKICLIHQVFNRMISLILNQFTIYLPAVVRKKTSFEHRICQHPVYRRLCKKIKLEFPDPATACMSRSSILTDISVK